MIFDTVHDFNKNLTPGNRLLGLDIGGKKTGIALSDIMRTIATPYKTVSRNKSIKKDVEELWAIIKEHYITGIVIGLPRQMDGSEGSSCQMVREFAKDLSQHAQIAIFFQDERMSTSAVKRALSETNLTRKKKSLLDDKMAAAYILQCLLDHINYIIKK
jgi:putative Holliday junction resolvase